MSRRPSASIVANPVLVGAVTVLVVVVAVFLAYNANNGLPFVPTSQVNVQIASGSNLVRGNEVREGGFRIGVVEEISQEVLPTGESIARLQLKLDQTVGEIPADTTIKIRPRSALGLKYVELTRGTSDEKLADGGTIPISQTNVPVQFDDIFKIFDAPTREAAQDNLNIFGSGLAARGAAINQLIGNLRPLLDVLPPVARNLSSEQTGIVRFLRELNDFTRILRPVARVNVEGFRDAATTFEAFSRDPDALRDTIAKSPPTLIVGTRSLRDQRPFLRNLVAFSADLRPAARDLRALLPEVTDALNTGTPVLLRTPQLNQRVANTLDVLKDLAQAPTTNYALRALSDTVGTTNPLVRFLGPYQTVCNSWNYFWTFLGEHVSEEDANGTAQRANLNMPPAGVNTVGMQGAFEPMNGETTPPDDLRNEEMGADATGLHGQPYPAAIDDQGRADCENGQRGFPEGPLAIRGPATDFDGNPTTVVADPHTPGNQGPTFKGRKRVPEGQTFTRQPEGPPEAKLAPELTTGIYGG